MTKMESSVIAKRIGLNITNLLISEGKAQDDLAKALGVSKSTVSLWCAGRRTPRMYHIDKIAEYFGTTRSAILEDGKAQPQISDRMREEINRLVDERMQAAGADQDQSPQFYDNEVVQIVTECLRKNPEYAAMFKAAAGLRPEDIAFVTRFIERMS
jgi:transcriptional regulator with XRE-family HTH domain